MNEPNAGQDKAAASIRPDTAQVLAGLKLFQRQSVEYVFDRLYGEGYTRRFLVADEVGLGKTLVARGVIAKTIDHLWDKVDRVDVVYICSNHDIARQNINRLNVTGKKDFALASRITLLPISQGNDRLRDQRLNFVSFTPGTSFELESSLGVSKERALLYHMLKDAWSLRGAAVVNVLRGDCTPDSFRWQLEQFPKWYKIDAGMQTAFLANLAGQPQLRTQFEELREQFHRSNAKVPAEVSRERSMWIVAMRAVLARSCLHALEPDLIILDEFRRFKQLLSGDAESEASQLAHDLFRYSNEHTEARVLMLSATPYKMYTTGHEAGEDARQRMQGHNWPFHPLGGMPSAHNNRVIALIDALSVGICIHQCLKISDQPRRRARRSRTYRTHRRTEPHGRGTALRWQDGRPNRPIPGTEPKDQANPPSHQNSRAYQRRELWRHIDGSWRTRSKSRSQPYPVCVRPPQANRFSFRHSRSVGRARQRRASLRCRSSTVPYFHARLPETSFTTLRIGALVKAGWNTEPRPAGSFTGSLYADLGRVVDVDVIDAFLHMAARPARPGVHVYNLVAPDIAADDPTLAVVNQLTVKPGSIDTAWYEQPANAYAPLYDTRRIAEEIGFTPKHSVRR